MKNPQPGVAQSDNLHDSAALWRHTSPAPASSDPDVTASPDPSSTPEPANFEIIWADSASEHSDDWSDVAQDPHTIQDIPSALTARTMAEDFSEGRLETLVGSPQKELAGTQNAYVSYLVTTKVQPSMRFKVATLMAALMAPHMASQMLTSSSVRLSVLPEARLLRSPSLHRLRLPLETAYERVSAMRRPPAARQA